MDCHAWSRAPPGLSFAVIRRAKREQPRGIVLARLICVRCKKDVKSVLRCRACGALCPTSRIGSALLSPGALAFYYFGSGRDTLVCLRRYDICPPRVASHLVVCFSPVTSVTALSDNNRYSGCCC